MANPTRQQILTRVQADFDLLKTSTNIPADFLDITAKALSGDSFLQYVHMRQLRDLMTPLTADEQARLRWARVWGHSPKAAGFSAGTVTIAGANGTVIPQGRVLTHSNGFEYETLEAVTIADGVATVAIAATTAGLGNLSIGAELALASPLAGVDSIVAASAINGGSLAETVDEMHVRLLKYLVRTAQGGGPNDYVTWLLAYPGVIKAWEYPKRLGPGSVGFAFLVDGDTPAEQLPSAPTFEAVKAYLKTKAPMDAVLAGFIPTLLTTNFTIGLSPNSEDVQDAVKAELVDLYDRESEPEATILLSKLRTAIGSAAGLDDYNLVTPNASIVPANGEYPVLGAFTWQTL